jgi:hypothetical protein
MSVVTRFAPSSTGMVLIGGARTPLFNRFSAKPKGESSVSLEDGRTALGVSMLKKQAHLAAKLASRTEVSKRDAKPEETELASACCKSDLTQSERRRRDCLAAGAPIDKVTLRALLKALATASGVEFGRIESGRTAPRDVGVPTPRGALNLLSREESLAQVRSSLGTRSCKAS